MTAARQTEFPIDAQFTHRWSPRAFTGEAISEAELLSMLEAARWAPSAYNAQPWRFIYARRDTAGWANIFEHLVPFNQSWAQRAGALVVILSRTHSAAPGSTELKPNPWHAFDTGSAWMSLALQASLSGWYAHGMAGYNEAGLRDALGVPEGYAIQAAAAIGKLADKSVLPPELQAREVPSDRRPLGAIVAEGRFSFED